MIESVHCQLEAALGDGVPIFVLHSSIDMDDCMAALLGEDGARARVIVASSVAESSITIKRVTHVIDSCRACEIHWTPASGEASPHIVWVSQAQAKQRAGRTGRTNDGTVWQLVAPSWYHGFADFEPAAMQLQLLRKEVLLLRCAQAKQLTDARKLLASCLDPPKVEVVNRGEQFLLDNKLIKQIKWQAASGRSTVYSLVPTDLGKLLDAMPVDLESAKLLLLGAFDGLLDEAVVLAVLRCTQPMPLKREPNKQREYERLIAHYGPAHELLDAFVEDEALANLAAYLSFQRWQCDPRRLRRVRQPVDDAESVLEGEVVTLGGLKNRSELNGQRVRVGKYDATRGRHAVELANGEQMLVRRINLIESEVEWCRERKISHTSMQAVARTVEVSGPTRAPRLTRALTQVLMEDAVCSLLMGARFDSRLLQHVMGTLYHHFPPLLCVHLAVRAAKPAPTHAAIRAVAARREGHVGKGAAFSALVSKRAEGLLRKLLQAMRVPQDRRAETASQLSNADGPCFYFRRGCCSVSQCPFSHRNSADTREICRFALTGSCKFGAKCRNRHPVVAHPTEQNAEVAALQARVQLGLGESMHLYASVDALGTLTSGDQSNCLPPPEYTSFRSVLLVGEGDFSFAASLAKTCKARSSSTGDGACTLQASAIVASTVQSEAEMLATHKVQGPQAIAELRAAGANALFGVDARKLDRHRTLGSALFPCIIWNLPFAADIAPQGFVKSEPNQLLLRGFFAAVARCTELRPEEPPPKVFVSVGINQFADWGLLAAADDCFLKVEAVHEFDPTRHGMYASRRNERDDAFDVGLIRTYAFAVDRQRVRSAALTVDTEDILQKRAVQAPVPLT